MGSILSFAHMYFNSKLESLPEALPAQIEANSYFLKGFDSQTSVTFIRLLLAGGLLLSLLARYYYEKHNSGGEESG